MKKKFIKILLLNLGLCILYVLAGKFGLTVAFENPSATAIWAPTGIALAAILIFGRRVIPAIFLGAFFVNLTTVGTITTSLGIAIGNTLEGIIGAYLVNKFANGIHAFEEVANILKYTFLVSIVATTISATLGILTLVLGGLSWNNFLSVWITWWFGDMGGNLIIAPFFLVWWTHPHMTFTFRHTLHFFISILTTLLVTWLVFSGIVPYPYLYIPIAVWIAFWFGRRGATTATLIVTGITIATTLSGYGPFAKSSLIQLQLFLNIFAFTALIFAAIVREIKKNEKTLASHEKRFQALIEKSFDAIVLVDATSKIIYASPSVKRILGYTPEALQGTSGFDLVAPEDKKLTMGTLEQLVREPGSVVTIEYRAIRKDKTIIWIEATGTNLLSESNVNAIVVNFHDITDKKLAEQKLFQEKTENQAMLRSIGDGIIATDREGKITMINKAACSMLGWKQNELIDKLLIDCIPFVDDANKPLPLSQRPLTKVITQGKIVVTSRIGNYVKKDGTPFPVHFTVTPIILDENFVGTIEVFQDITKEKEIDKAKSEFVSVASHQLRTPLATINWYLEELMRTGQNLNEKQGNYLQEVYAASKRMISLINALLNASRLELGTLTIKPEKIDILAIIHQLLQDFHAQVEKKNITVQENYQENIPLLTADAKLLTIIMQNLLSNAIKYSKMGGKIELKILYNEKEFLISVTDDGYGIPKNQTAKIFTKLFRADNARIIDPEGSGLGLYIVKEIVDTTGGKIWFVSQENKGTIFSVSFPATGMHKKEGQKASI